MRVLAITPARGGSKGIPRKNINIVAGKPLLQYTIEAAQACTSIDRYIVNSEDEEIRSLAKQLGAETQDRPQEFWHDNTFQEVDRLLRWIVAEIEAAGNNVEVVVLLYATSPLRTAKVIDDCIQKVLTGGYDSALTLSEDRSYLWELLDKEEVLPTNYDPKERGPNQIEGWNQWRENKAVYAVRRDLLMDGGCRLGGRIGHVQMTKLDSIDIDTPEDLLLAEKLLILRNEKKI